MPRRVKNPPEQHGKENEDDETDDQRPEHGENLIGPDPSAAPALALRAETRA
jgi:hypothetical protein